VLGRELEEIWKGGEMIDVTLVCDDRKQVSAHKVVLAAYSPFFREIINNNPHQKPLIYLKGTAYNDLILILNFLYTGEARVSQNHLKEFLEVAADLKIKGLIQEKKTNTKCEVETNPMSRMDSCESASKSIKSEVPEVFEDFEDENESNTDNYELDADQPIAGIPMLDDGAQDISCTICDSILKNRKSYRNHMITKHKYPKHKPTEYKCEVCNTVYTRRRQFQRCRHKVLDTSNDMSDEHNITRDMSEEYDMTDDRIELNAEPQLTNMPVNDFPNVQL